MPSLMDGIVGIAVTALVLTGCTSTNDAVSETKSAEPPAAGQQIYVDVAGKCDRLTPCLPNLSDALKSAGEGDTISVFDGNYALTSPDASTPALIIDKSVTITSYDSADANDNCPEVAQDCPQLVISGMINTPIVIAADNVSLNNLAITQQETPGSNPVSAIIHVPLDASADKLIAGTQLAELALVGGRRGVWYSGMNGLVSTSRFSDQARDSIFVPATTGSFNVFGSTFSGGGGKAVLFESQVGSPASSGNVKLSFNALNGKGNFAIWNSWAEGITSNSTTLTIDHNTVVGTSGAATAILPSSPTPGFSVFSAITYSNNIVQGAGGDAFYIDYTYSPTPAAAPTSGQIAVSNSLAYQNTASAGTNDPSGNYGFSKGAPDGTALGIFDLTKQNLNNVNPLLTLPAELDFSLLAKSPALGSGVSGSNIGQWQGTRPLVRRVQPSCAAPGSQVVVVATNVKGTPTVTFGDAPADVVSVKANKRTRISVTVPDGAAGRFVDVTVRDSNGVGTLPQGFHYPAQGGKC